MIPGLTFSLCFPLAVGLLVARLCEPGGEWKGRLAFDLSLAAGLGLGLVSCLFFFWRLWFASARWLWLAEGALCLILAWLLGPLSRPAFLEPAPQSALKPPPARALPIAKASYFLLLAVGMVAFAGTSVTEPHGQWDAWAIWNLRARFLYRGGTEWMRTFTPLLSWSHPDYPLLLPASVARAWSYAGCEDPAAPALIAALFTFATVGLLTTAVASLRGSLQGYLAGLALLATPQFLRHGASQYADVPLAFFLLATLSLLCLHERQPRPAPGALVGAGLAAALMAWTKNEGIVCLFFSTAAWLILPSLLRDGKKTLEDAPWYVAGLLPGLGTTVYFKLALAGPSDLLSRATWEILLDRAGEVSSWASIIGTLGSALFSLGGSRVSVPVALAAYWILLGPARRSPQPAAPLAALLALAAITTGYCLVYLATPYELSWHLATSAQRLLLQLWPSFLFTYFIFAASPTEGAEHPPLPRQAPAHPAGRRR